MNDQQTVIHYQNAAENHAQGIKMFKDRMAAMKDGPWQLGGERDGKAAEGASDQGDL